MKEVLLATRVSLTRHHHLVTIFKRIVPSRILYQDFHHSKFKQKTALFPEVVEGGLAVKRSSDDGESISSSNKQGISEGGVNEVLDNRKSLETLASRASSMAQVGSVLDKMSTNESFLNKYEFLNEIGRGGFSRVFRCRSRKVQGDEYAVKVIDLRPMRLKEKFDPARLRREVDIMKKLRHRNIVYFYEGYETDDSVLLVLELCPGKELFDVILERNSFSEVDAKPAFTQVCSAVYYLHCLNIIHRDIKPENILVLDRRDAAGNLVIKLLDFGLSKNAGAGSEAKTFVGTPCYLAPEVEYTSKGLGGTYGLPADCWSLGAVLYVMLVARFPEFEQDSAGKVVLKLPPVLWSNVSSEAKALVSGLMNTNQYARLTSGAALQHEWLGSYRISGEELGRQAAAVMELGQGLQEDLDKDIAVTGGGEDSGVSMTAGVPAFTGQIWFCVEVMSTGTDKQLIARSSSLHPYFNFKGVLRRALRMPMPAIGIFRKLPQISAEARSFVAISFRRA